MQSNDSAEHLTLTVQPDCALFVTSDTANGDSANGDSANSDSASGLFASAALAAVQRLVSIGCELQTDWGEIRSQLDRHIATLQGAHAVLDNQLHAEREANKQASAEVAQQRRRILQLQEDLRDAVATAKKAEQQVRQHTRLSLASTSNWQHHSTLRLCCLPPHRILA
jgi:hypothetical protein